MTTKQPVLKTVALYKARQFKDYTIVNKDGYPIDRHFTIDAYNRIIHTLYALKFPYFEDDIEAIEDELHDISENMNTQITHFSIDPSFKAPYDSVSTYMHPVEVKFNTYEFQNNKPNPIYNDDVKHFLNDVYNADKHSDYYTYSSQHGFSLDVYTQLHHYLHQHAYNTLNNDEKNTFIKTLINEFPTQYAYHARSQALTNNTIDDLFDYSDKNGYLFTRDGQIIKPDDLC